MFSSTSHLISSSLARCFLLCLIHPWQCSAVMSWHAASIASRRDIWSKTFHLNEVEESGVRGKEDGHHSRMGARLWLLWEWWNTTMLHVITYIDKWSPTCPLSLAPVFGADLLKSPVYAGVNFPHNISPTMSSFTVYHMIKNLNTWVCFKSQHEQLFTLTLAYKLGLEHDVICSDIQCESICKFGSKITLFWSWLC